jgi:hypothetical protein
LLDEGLEGPRSASHLVFDAARRRGFIQDMLSELSGRSADLLSFDSVREQLHLSEAGQDSSLQEIPLDKIVGSVGRYRDFNRAFLPRTQIDPERWTRIERMQRRTGLPPIRVYKVGDVYFVIDGNHRVSVARARGLDTIWAHVTEIPIRVPLETTTTPDDLLLKAGYTVFLEKTSLDKSCPEQQIELTRPGGYQSLLQHIEVHQFYMGLRSQHYPTLPEAALDWYQRVYLPVVERIRNSGILRHFPNRTEADLYLWIAENRARLQMRYGGREKASEAVDDFAQEHHGLKLLRTLRRLLRRAFRRTSPSEPAPRE